LKAVSVIIPIYNAEKYLAECLDSLVEQSLKNIDVLLINDGSTDNSRIIAEEYVTKYSDMFRLINKENGGVASARNMGLELAEGEYVTFLDPDDYVLPNTYERMYSEAQGTDSDTFIGNIRCFNTEKTWGIPYMAKIFDTSLPKLRHITTHPELSLSPSSCNKLFKKSLLLEHNLKFDEEISVGEDLLFTQQCLYLANKTCVVNMNSLNYRVIQSESSLSKREDISFFIHHYKSVQKLKEFYIENNLEKYSSMVERAQWKFFIDSLFLRQKKLSKEDIDKVFDIAWNFYQSLINTFSMDELAKVFNHYELLAHDFLKNKQKKDMFLLLDIMKKPEQYKKSNVLTKKAEVYSFLYKYFPKYDKYLRIKNVNFKKLNSVLKLEEFSLYEGVLTIGGYIFHNGYVSEKSDKKKLVFRNLKTKSEIVIDLENELRTDITNYSGARIQNYDYCGFKTRCIDLSELGLENGFWEILILVEKDVNKKLRLERRIQSKLVEVKRAAKRNLINNTQIDTLLNRTHLTIKVSQVSLLRRLKNKLIMHKQNLKQEVSLLRKGNYKAFYVLWLYKLFGDYFKKKDIWFIGERNDTAQDNSYHMFKYIRTEHPDVRCYYVIDKDSTDLARINQYGNIVYSSTIKHTFLLLVASKVINSYSDKVFMHTQAYKDIIHIYPEWNRNRKNIFLQHGVIGVSRVNHALHKNKTNYDMFIVSSKGEKNHIIKEYGHQEDEVKLTGLARWDNLSVKYGKQDILIMPTWRAWITDENSLLESEYFKRLQSLINNKELHTFIEENDLTINFYLHYEAQRLLESVGVNLDTGSKNIRIIKKDVIAVQELLKSNALLITDYSTVSFDFAYMQKPVIFYQFDYHQFFSKHYREGIINHSTDLFGKVVKEEDELVAKIKYYGTHNMKMEAKYKEKTKRFVMKPKSGTHCELIFQEIKSVK
jgi:glycosyltransferase involved in cell wall biosynthesis/CDP-glycerol glycerophosphotransferase (TagB/SpsB family)